MSTVLTKYYQLRESDMITLTITIGTGQSAYTTVKLGRHDLVLPNTKGSFTTPIGRGQALRGMSMFCTTVETDLKPGTNETEITYELTGGITDFKYSLQQSAAPNNVVFYNAEFMFYS